MRIGVAVVAYQASSTIVGVLDAIDAAVGGEIVALLVADDASSDPTATLARDWLARDRPYDGEALHHDRNLGYGGNQKSAIRWAHQQGLDVLVLLHGDGQHLPSEIPTLVDGIRSGGLDAVFGARTLVPGAARAGGMPLVRYGANRALSRIQNRLAGTEFAEWHSGFRAYRMDALGEIDLDVLPDWFDFDCAITLALLDSGARLGEVPCTTRYGDEVSRVALVRYGLSVLGRAVRHRWSTEGAPAAPVHLESSVSHDALKP
jgi:glycosyltransferase involved in cell wall biosynthesis